MAVGVDTRPKSTLRYQDIHIGWRDLCLHDIAVLFTAEIPSVQHFHPVNFDYEHGSSYDVPRHIGCDFYPLLFHLYSKTD